MDGIRLYESIPFDLKSVMYYAGLKEFTPETENLIESCKKEVLPLAKPAICSKALGKSDIESFLSSAEEGSGFSTYMNGIENAVLFAATIGHDFDRLLIKYEKLSIAKAQMMQAIGVQQVESLCDMFCEEIKKEHPLSKSRFSPGFGGLGLENQKLIFDILGCDKALGIRLNESYLITPSKTVTAFVALR